MTDVYVATRTLSPSALNAVEAMFPGEQVLAGLSSYRLSDRVPLLIFALEPELAARFTWAVLALGVVEPGGAVLVEPYSLRIAVAETPGLAASGLSGEHGLIPLGVVRWSSAARSRLATTQTFGYLTWERRRHGWWSCIVDESTASRDAEFSEVFSREVNEWIAIRRRSGPAVRAGRNETLANQRRPDVANEMYGIALAGGGMRSAVFSLGVSQALSRHGLFESADYLSTASGGGYFGLSLQALANEELPYDDVPRLGASFETFPYRFPRNMPASSGTFAVHGPETPATWHVRKYAKLLGKSIGLLDLETWMTVSRFVLSIVALWLVFLLPLFVVLASGGVAAWNLGLEDWSVSWRERFAVWGAFGGLTLLHLGLQEFVGRTRSALLLLVAALGVYLLGAGLTGFERGHAMAWGALFVLAAMLGLVSIAFGTTAEAVARRLSIGLIALWLAAPVVVAAGLGVWMLRSDPTWNDVVFSLDLPSGWSQAVVAGSTVATGGILAAGIRRIWSSSLTAGSRVVRSERAVKVVIGIAGYLFLFLIVVLASWGLAILWDRGLGLPQPWRKSWGTLAFWSVVGFAVALLVATLAPGVHSAGRWLLNRLSINEMYARRITNTWIIGAKPGGRTETEGGLAQWTKVWPRPDLTLAGVAPEKAASRAAEGPGPTLPYPIACTSVNIPGSRGERLPERLADSFVLAPFHCGSSMTHWIRTERAADLGGMSLGTVASVSGAAFSPLVGQKATRLPAKTLSIILTAFNARLGRWVENPRAPQRANPVADWLFGTPLMLFYRELFGLASREDKSVYLTDGGHFDNLALYELIRRRCKFIVAVAADAEDPDGDDKLGNIAEAIRLVRVDFGVQVSIPDFAPLIRNEDGTVHSFFAVGRIAYPPLWNEGGRRRPPLGYLVLVKSGLQGLAERPGLANQVGPDLYNYWKENPAFPYDSTTDQQFDQAQFEAYRQLGYLAGNTVGHAAGESGDTLEWRFAQLQAAFNRSLSGSAKP